MTVIADEAQQPRLTNRQHQILQLTADGKSAREICQELYIEYSTLKVHRRFINANLNAVSTVNAVAIGLRAGLIQ